MRSHTSCVCMCVDDGREKRDLIAAHKAELLKKQREAEEAAAAATEVAEAAAARKVNKRHNTREGPLPASCTTHALSLHHTQAEREAQIAAAKASAEEAETEAREARERAERKRRKAEVQVPTHHHQRLWLACK